jgi:hypothetical protein
VSRSVAAARRFTAAACSSNAALAPAGARAGVLGLGFEFRRGGQGGLGALLGGAQSRWIANVSRAPARSRARPRGRRLVAIGDHLASERGRSGEDGGVWGEGVGGPVELEEAAARAAAAAAVVALEIA